MWIYVDITQNHCEKQLKNILVCRLIMSYNEQEFKDNSSGRGVIPHRRYSPRPAQAADLVTQRRIPEPTV